MKRCPPAASSPAPCAATEAGSQKGTLKRQHKNNTHTQHQTKTQKTINHKTKRNQHTHNPRAPTRRRRPRARCRRLRRCGGCGSSGDRSCNCRLRAVRLGRSWCPIVAICYNSGNALCSVGSDANCYVRSFLFLVVRPGQELQEKGWMFLGALKDSTC